MPTSPPRTTIQAYKDPDVFQDERREIFGRGWQFAAPSVALGEPGDYLALGLGGWQVFLLRGSDGAVRAFHNVCRHQGLPVVENGPGRCGPLRCRYHGWTYDFDGKLEYAPPAVCPEDMETKEYRLGEVALATWRGLLLANLDSSAGAGDAEPEADLLGASLGTIDPEPWRLADHRITSLGLNWKLVADEIIAGPRRVLPDAETAAIDDARGLRRRRGDERWLWLWPSASLHASPDGLVMDHLVPRTFLKTEIHSYALCPGGRPQPAAFGDRLDEMAVAAGVRMKRLAEGSERVDDGLAIDRTGLSLFREWTGRA